MKKVFAWVCLFLLVAFLVVPLSSLAESTEPVKLELTGVLQSGISLITAALAAGITYVWNKWVKPWLIQRDLMHVAEMVVAAVEAALGRHKGAEKWALALEKMASYGYDIDSGAVLDALSAAWKKLDLTQLTAGEKKLEEEKPPEEESTAE